MSALPIPAVADDAQATAAFISAATLARWLDDVDEIAVIDVREAGQFGEGHALLAVNIPYSRLELDIAPLVPRTATRIVLIAQDDAGAARAAAALRAIGYTHLHALAGGSEAWQASGQLLLQGVNVPSKAFAEFVEHVYHTPDIESADLAALQAAGADLVLLDSRTVEEYRRFHVPGAVSCPGSELVLRFNDLVPSPDTLVVVSCAGRTRGVMGAQTLINAGVPNQVRALSGGTQGWKLAGLALTSVNEGEFREASAASRQAAAARAREVALRFQVSAIDAGTLAAWRADAGRTTYVFDIRTEDEYVNGHIPGAVWAQGVQLIQCLDQWAAVRQARLVLTDDDASRATLTAHWLRQLGWDARVLKDAGDLFTGRGKPPSATRGLPDAITDPVPEVGAPEAAALVAAGAVLLDAGSSGNYRQQHPRGAVWVNRSALTPWLTGTADVVVLAGTDAEAQLVARDLRDAGLGAGIARRVVVLRGGLKAWTAAGLPTEATPGQPADSDRIDFLFWLHDRHEGNAASSAAYLQWEADLPATLGDGSRAGFRFPA